MDGADFHNLLEDELNRIRAILDQKAGEYATDDRLHNFKVAAEMQGITPKQALGGMMAKHTVSIYDMISDDSEMEFDMSRWTEKITDHLNYLILLKALVVEGYSPARFAYSNIGITSSWNEYTHKNIHKEDKNER